MAEVQLSILADRIADVRRNAANHGRDLTTLFAGMREVWEPVVIPPNSVLPAHEEESAETSA
jgi:hypothetical protein